MIFLFHGDNLSKSRQTIVHLQNRLKATNKKEVAISEITPQELKEMCASFDIFSEPPFIVLDIASTNNKNLSEYTESLHQMPKGTNLLVLADKELPKSNAFLKEVPNVRGKVILSNRIHQSNIFKFVDALFFKDRKKAYKELRTLLIENEDPYYLFSMVLYGLRNVANAKFEAPSLSKAAQFVKSKAQKQAKNFTEKEIATLYKTIYQTDKKLKTGKISPDIVIPYTIEKILS